ncbi:integrator complex subunit 7, partial [Brachionus plicatilis]
MCVRYTHYDLSEKIYQNLSLLMTGAIHNMSTNDLSYKSWFEFMSLVCKAESALVKTEFESFSELMTNLNQSFNEYTRAQTLFKSLCSRCLTHSNSLTVLENSSTCFQIRFCELRCEQIKLFIHLSMSLLTYRTVPTPVFQLKSSENLARYGRIAQQMKYGVVELQKLNQKFKDFISECFDADEHTINILNIKLLDEFYTNFLNSYVVKSESLNDIFPEKGPKYVQYAVELKIVESFLLNLIEKLPNLCTNESESRTEHIRQFQEIFVDFIQLPIPLPRAFFTSLQKTSIKLIVTPNNKKTNSILTIRNDQTLVVKIDGIINQHFKTKNPIRTVKKVQICLTTELDSKSIPDNKFGNIKFIDVKTMLEVPKNDYFTSNILVSFPYFGNYVIQVDLYILDNSDMIW